jgi:hypothetical protein
MHPLVRSTLVEIERATAGMTADDWQRHPDGKWSAAEVLEHLSITFGSTAKGLQKVLDAGRHPSAKRSAAQFFRKLVVIDIGYFPSGRKAPTFTVPTGISGEEALRRVRDYLPAMDQAINECERRFGSKIIGPHPVIGPLTAEQWRRFHLIHTRHHMKQIARLRAERAVAATPAATAK